MQPAQQPGHEGPQGQSGQYILPPAPTFASLGAHSMPFTGSLGSLAQGQHQPPQQPGQGNLLGILSCPNKLLQDLKNHF